MAKSRKVSPKMSRKVARKASRKVAASPKCAGRAGAIKVKSHKHGSKKVKSHCRRRPRSHKKSHSRK